MYLYMCLLVVFGWVVLPLVAVHGSAVRVGGRGLRGTRYGGDARVVVALLLLLRLEVGCGGGGAGLGGVGGWVCGGATLLLRGRVGVLVGLVERHVCCVWKQG